MPDTFISADPETLSVEFGVNYNLSDEQSAAVLARAEQINATIYKGSHSIAALPRPTQLALLKQGLESIQHEAAVAAAPPKATAAQAQQVNLERAAFGKNRSLSAAGPLLAFYQEAFQLDRKSASALMAERAKAWKANLGNLKPGENPWPKDARKTARSLRQNGGGGSGAGGGGKNSNPFSPDYKGADKHARIATLIRDLGTKKASAMSAAAGVDLSLRPLK
jgi:hypothetical protein